MYGHQGEKGDGKNLGTGIAYTAEIVSMLSIYTYTLHIVHIYNTLLILRINKWLNENPLQSTGNTSILCGDLNGKEIQKRVDICIRIANSLHCSAEANITL